MPETPWLPQIKLISDGNAVDAATVNSVFGQLSQREQYLYEKFLETADLSVLTAFDQPIHPDEIAANTITPGKLQVGYYETNTNGAGVKRAIVSLDSSATNTSFSAAKSSYAFGIIKNVTSTNTVDLWLQGLVNLPINIDDATNGLLEFQSANVVETFRVGPYYLSQKTPGKLTSNPSGLGIYIGYALNKTTFLLSPNVEEFSQLFINYHYNVLDRPTAVPVVTSSVWSIPNSDMTRLGWVDITWLQANNPSALASYTIPAGAKFLYNIPAAYTTDNADNSGAGSLSANEIAEATELGQLLPPEPANFSLLTVNGVVQTFLDQYRPDGIYSIDSFGIWWYTNADGYQPWAKELASSWTPANWPSNKGTEADRPRIFLQFAKFNPSFKSIIVTSLAPYQDNTNDSTSSIQLLDKTSHNPSTFGDLLIKFNLLFNTDVTQTQGNQALANLVYNAVSGKLTRTFTPVVASVAGAPGSGVTVTESPSGSGNMLLSYQSQGISGQVYDLEPENAELDYLGNSLHSYLKFPNLPLPRSFGVVGKIVLPEQFPANKDLYIVLHLIGLSDVSSTNQNVGFNFSYNVSTVVNGNAPASVLTANSTMTNAVLGNDSSPTLVTVTLPTNYKAQQAYKFKASPLIVPAASIGEDSIVNFRLTRNILSTNHYAADVGLLAVYWSIAP